jgi:hypothetical protein
MTSVTLTLSNNTTDFTTYLTPPILLDSSKSYEATFLSLETYNSIPNITEKNNVFKYSTNNGLSWKIIHLPKDAYEYDQIRDEIQRQMIENDDYDKVNDTFYIEFSTIRLYSAIEITNPSYRIDFGVHNSVGPNLGFTDEMLLAGCHKSPKIVDITKVNSILVNVDLVSGSYINGIQSPSIHNFSPKVGPGYKIIEQPNPELIYYPVTRTSISSVRLWLTDQNNNPLDLQEERITVRILIRENKN